MQLVRVVATAMQGGHKAPGCTVILLCGIDGQCHLVPGEWFGCVQNGELSHPFVLRQGQEFYYGGLQHWVEPTNIGTKRIDVSTYFTLTNDVRDAEKFEATYCITSLFVLGKAEGSIACFTSGD